jgi:hypothetical protein
MKRSLGRLIWQNAYLYFNQFYLSIFSACSQSYSVELLLILTNSFMVKIDLVANALVRKQFDADCKSIKESITVLQLQNEQLYLRIKALIQQNRELIDKVKACIKFHSHI